MLYHWKTEKMVAALQAACPDAKIHNTGQGGDCDTDNLVVERAGHRMFVSGYDIEEGLIRCPSDHMVEAIVVCDGRDSRGGLSSNEPEAIDLYCAVRKVVGAEINGTKCFVANHHDELF